MWSGRRPWPARAPRRSAGSARRAPGSAMKRPVWTPPRSIASSIARRRLRCSRSSSVRGQLARRAAAGTAWPATAPRRRAGCRCRPRAPGRAAWPSAAPSRARRARGTPRRRPRRRPGRRARSPGSSTARPEPALVAQRQPAAARELDREAVPGVRRRLLVDDDPPGHARGAGRAPAPRRRRSPPTGTSRAGGRRSACARRARRRSRPGACGRQT